MSGIHRALTTLCLTAAFAGLALADSATSHISIVKTAALSTSKFDAGYLYRTEQSGVLSTTTCLHTDGGLIPYRVSMSSNSSKTALHLTQNGRNASIPYRVAWSGNRQTALFEKQNRQSRVFSAEEHTVCLRNQVHIVLDDSAYRAAPDGQYVDTLTVMLHIE